MRSIVCLGDKNTHGGCVINASSSVYLDGAPAAIVEDLVSCPKHGVNKIIQGGDSVFDNNVALVVDGCLCACGCRVISSRHVSFVE